VYLNTLYQLALLVTNLMFVNYALGRVSNVAAMNFLGCNPEFG
jgi:hypothetical protein